MMLCHKQNGSLTQSLLVESHSAERIPLLSELLREESWLDPILAPDLVYGLCLKDYPGVIEPLYNFVLQN